MNSTTNFITKSFCLTAPTYNCDLITNITKKSKQLILATIILQYFVIFPCLFMLSIVLDDVYLFLTIIIRYGVISTPEVADWQSLNISDNYLVAASDGIFEKMTIQDVCDLLWDEKVRKNIKFHDRHSFTLSLADHIVDAASKKGTVDNMAAIVVPLRFTGTSEFFSGGEYDQLGISEMSSFGLEKALHRESGDNLKFEFYLCF